MTKQDAIYLANERCMEDGKTHTIYNSHTIEGYFVDKCEDKYTAYRVIGKNN